MQLPTPPGWGQWQQNEVESGYVHIGSPMMGTQTPLQQPTLSSQYPVTLAPSPSLQQPISYAPYTHGLPSVAPLQMPTVGSQHNHQHQHQHHHSQHHHQQHQIQFPDHSIQRPRRKLVNTRSLRDTTAEAMEAGHRGRTTPERATRRVPKTIVANAPVVGASHVGNHVEFNTSVDKLMKIIQSMPETGTLVESIESVVKPEPVRLEEPEKAVSPIDEQKPASERLTVRRFVCHFRGCLKKFAQKAQLDTHVRSHTGERPYVCEFPNCGKRFSQSGNLHTHERKHTGERPYVCDICGRRFAQGGNRQAHKKVHQKTKDFICRLEGCGKEFTQRGNLKSHQNKSHQQFMDQTMARLEKISLENMSPEDRELVIYLAPLYKNSNKGIKGRGVRPPGYRLSRSDRSSSMSSSAHSYSPTKSEASLTSSPCTAGPPPQHHYGGHAQQHHHQQQQHQHQQRHPDHQDMSSYHPSNPVPTHHHQRPQQGLAYPPVSFGSAPSGNIRYPYNGIVHRYEMPEHSHPYSGIPVTTSSSTSSPVATVYSDDSGAVYQSDDNGARELAFGERMC
ncbi:hypothetical protein RB597_002214 [Gaeumannomyces tritici]